MDQERYTYNNKRDDNNESYKDEYDQFEYVDDLDGCFNEHISSSTGSSHNKNTRNQFHTIVDHDHDDNSIHNNDDNRSRCHDDPYSKWQSEQRETQRYAIISSSSVQSQQPFVGTNNVGYVYNNEHKIWFSDDDGNNDDNDNNDQDNDNDHYIDNNNNNNNKDDDDSSSNNTGITIDCFDDDSSQSVAISIMNIWEICFALIALFDFLAAVSIDYYNNNNDYYQTWLALTSSNNNNNNTKKNHMNNNTKQQQPTTSSFLFRMIQETILSASIILIQCNQYYNNNNSSRTAVDMESNLDTTTINNNNNEHSNISMVLLNTIINYYMKPFLVTMSSWLRNNSIRFNVLFAICWFLDAFVRALQRRKYFLRKKWYETTIKGRHSLVIRKQQQQQQHTNQFNTTKMNTSTATATNNNSKSNQLTSNNNNNNNNTSPLPLLLASSKSLTSMVGTTARTVLTTTQPFVMAWYETSHYYYGSFIIIHLLLLHVGFYVYCYNCYIELFFINRNGIYNDQVIQVSHHHTHNTHTHNTTTLDQHDENVIVYTTETSIALIGAIVQHLYVMISIRWYPYIVHIKELGRHLVYEQMKRLIKHAILHPIRYRNYIIKLLHIIRWIQYLQPLFDKVPQLIDSIIDLKKRYQQYHNSIIAKQFRMAFRKQLNHNELIEYSAIHIQNVYRTYKQRQLYKQLYSVFQGHVQTNAAIKIQSIFKKALQRARQRIVLKQQELKRLKQKAISHANLTKVPTSTVALRLLNKDPSLAQLRKVSSSFVHFIRHGRPSIVKKQRSVIETLFHSGNDNDNDDNDDDNHDNYDDDKDNDDNVDIDIDDTTANNHSSSSSNGIMNDSDYMHMYALEKELKRYINNKLLLRPNTKFGVIWKYMVVIAIVVEIVLIAYANTATVPATTTTIITTTIAPSSTSTSTNNNHKDNMMIVINKKQLVHLDTTEKKLQYLLVPVPVQYNPLCRQVKDNIWKSFHSISVGLYSMLRSIIVQQYTTTKQQQHHRQHRQQHTKTTKATTRLPWYCTNQWYCTIQMIYIHIVQLMIQNIFFWIGIICYMDVFVVFFTGIYNPKNGMLQPKPFLERWIIPGLGFQLLVNPLMSTTYHNLYILYQICIHYGIVRTIRWSVALFYPASICMVTILRMIWKQIVLYENKYHCHNNNHHHYQTSTTTTTTPRINNNNKKQQQQQPNNNNSTIICSIDKEREMLLK